MMLRSYKSWFILSDCNLDFRVIGWKLRIACFTVYFGEGIDLEGIKMSAIGSI